MAAPLSRVGVGVIATRPNGDILFGYRIKVGEPPCWCLPGGHVEPGETFEAAARRELEEETAIMTRDPMTTVAILQQLSDEHVAITAAVTVSLDEGATPRVTEPEVFSKWGWFDRDALPDAIFPASRAALAVWKSMPPPPGWHGYDCQP